MQTQITGAHLLPVMCPLVEMNAGWGVESTSLPLCQPVRNAAQGNFRMSLCFGRLSSSSSPVILWSCLALFLTLCLPSWVWRERRHVSGLRRERQKYPIHLVRFPPQGHSYTFTSQAPLLMSPSQVTGGKKTPPWFMPDTRRDFSNRGPY